MKIARFASSALVGLSVVLALSCSKTKEDEKPVPGPSDATFKVSVNLMEASRAEVVVRHNGKDSDTWYGFVTEDVTSEVNDLIKAQLPNVTKSTLHVGTVQTVEVPSLEEYARYRYIAFGVTEGKELYGTPGSLVFTTNPNLDIEFVVSSDAVATTSATINITHEKESYLTYAGYLSTNTEADIDELAAEGFNSLVENGKIRSGVELFSGSSKTVNLTDLASDTAYRYVVFGIFVDEDDTAIYYGTPAETSFSTTVDYDAVTFTAEAATVGKNVATFNVSYNTASDLSWYAFTTSDLETPAATLIGTALEGITADDLTTGKTTFEAKDLESVTNYRLIVTGVKDGAAFGTPADLKFITADEDYDEISFTAEVLEESIDMSGAKFKVTNSVEKETLQWIYVVSTDLEADAGTLLPAAADVAEEDIQTGNAVEITLSDLSPKTEYRVIVKGYRVDSAGDKYLYGTPADVTFKTTSFYQPTTDWTLSVTDGDTTYEGYPFKVTNTVKDGSEAGKYFFTLYTADAVTPFDGDLDAFLASIIEDEVAHLQKEAQTGGKTIADLLKNGTSSSYWRMSFKEYYIFAIGLDDEGKPTGKYAYTTYTNKPSAEDIAAYEKWLGTWTNSGKVIEVSQKEQCVSYNISGLFPALGGTGFEGVIEGGFNASTGNLTLKAYVTDIKYNNTTYGPIQMAIRGFYLDGSNYRAIGGTYDVAEAEMGADEKSATLQPKKLTLTSGTQVTLAGINVVGLILEGEYAGRFLNYNASPTPFAIPAEIKRPSDTGSEAYNAWLGDWDIIGRNVADTADSTFFTLNVAQDVADVSYKISGWGGITGANPPTSEGTFTASTGALGIKSATLLTGQTISGIDGVCKVGLCGFFTYTDGKTYFDSDEGQTLAVCTNPTGTVSVAQGTWSSGVYYVQMNLMAMPEGTTTGYRLWSNSLSIPFKMVKSTAGGASVKSVPSSSLKAFGKPVRMGRLPDRISRDEATAVTASVIVE